MYFIVNSSKPPRCVVIADLKFELQPRQAVDLDKFFERGKIDRSSNLQEAKRMGLIKIKQVSGVNLPKETAIEKVSDLYIGNSDAQIEKLQKQIITMQEAMKVQMKDHATTIADALKTKQDNKELTKVLKDLKSALEQGKLSSQTTIIEKTVEHAAGSSAPVEEAEREIDPKVAAEIHARSVEDLTKNAKGSIEHKTKKTKDNVLINVDELDNLLG